MTKKMSSRVKVATKKTKLLIKKANVKISKKVASLKKDWQSDKPRRDNLKDDLKVSAENMFRKGMKIGEDVAEVIKKDIKEINNK